MIAVFLVLAGVVCFVVALVIGDGPRWSHAIMSGLIATAGVFTLAVGASMLAGA